jgi:RHH-type transcriptional regulator, rel operon repressor / antitoxin RelB
MLAIRLPEDIEARLDKLAKRTGRTKTFYARQAILEHLDDLEDVFLAEKRLASLRASRTRSVSIDKVLTAHELDD